MSVHRKPTAEVGGFKVYLHERFVTHVPVVKVLASDPHRRAKVEHSLEPDEAERLARWLLYVAQEVKDERKAMLKGMIRPA